MRIAIISDVHGNIHALEATLADVQNQGVDLIVFAGDLVKLIRQEVVQARGFLMPFFHQYWQKLEAGAPLEPLVHEFLATSS